MRTVIVTGGAGYVGSHCCAKLLSAGYLPIVYDNLSTGHREFIQFGPFEPGDVRDTNRLIEVMRRHKPVALMHFAADIEVGLAETTPGKCLNNNAGGLASVIAASEAADVEAIVFSSTCAIFGETDTAITEQAPRHPKSVYGLSKHIGEQMLQAVEQRGRLRAARLRYFNAAGADPLGRLGEAHDPETHLIPIIFEAAMGQRDCVRIFGTDYETEDGTAVRDYIHVLDLADAHVLALQRLLQDRQGFALNLGTGAGHSVRDVIRRAERVAGRLIPVRCDDRRAGDPTSLVADPAKASSLLGWTAKFTLDDILRDAWMWHSVHRDLRLPVRLAAE